MDARSLMEVADRWFDAFNEHNIEKLLALYDPQAQHFSPKLKALHPETNGLIQGTAALRAWWEGAFKRLPSLQYEVIRLTPYEDRIFMEYMRHAKGEEDLFVGEMLELRDGLIIASSVFHR